MTYCFVSPAHAVMSVLWLCLSSQTLILFLPFLSCSGVEPDLWMHAVPVPLPSRQLQASSRPSCKPALQMLPLVQRRMKPRGKLLRQVMPCSFIQQCCTCMAIQAACSPGLTWFPTSNVELDICTRPCTSVSNYKGVVTSSNHETCVCFVNKVIH